MVKVLSTGNPKGTASKRRPRRRRQHPLTASADKLQEERVAGGNNETLDVNSTNDQRPSAIQSSDKANFEASSGDLKETVVQLQHEIDRLRARLAAGAILQRKLLPHALQSDSTAITLSTQDVQANHSQRSLPRQGQIECADGADGEVRVVVGGEKTSPESSTKRRMEETKSSNEDDRGDEAKETELETLQSKSRQIQLDLQNQILQMQENHGKSLSHVEINHQKELEATRTDYESKLEKVQLEHKAALQKMCNEESQRSHLLKRNHAAEIEDYRAKETASKEAASNLAAELLQAQLEAKELRAKNSSLQESHDKLVASTKQLQDERNQNSGFHVEKIAELKKANIKKQLELKKANEMRDHYEKIAIRKDRTAKRTRMQADKLTVDKERDKELIAQLRATLNSSKGEHGSELHSAKRQALSRDQLPTNPTTADEIQSYPSSQDSISYHNWLNNGKEIANKRGQKRKSRLRIQSPEFERDHSTRV